MKSLAKRACLSQQSDGRPFTLQTRSSIAKLRDLAPLRVTLTDGWRKRSGAAAYLNES